MTRIYMSSKGLSEHMGAFNILCSIHLVRYTQQRKTDGKKEKERGELLQVLIIDVSVCVMVTADQSHFHFTSVTAWSSCDLSSCQQRQHVHGCVCEREESDGRKRDEESVFQCLIISASLNLFVFCSPSKGYFRQCALQSLLQIADCLVMRMLLQYMCVYMCGHAGCCLLYMMFQCLFAVLTREDLSKTQVN